jgi:hypothetical protein
VSTSIRAVAGWSLRNTVTRDRSQDRQRDDARNRAGKRTAHRLRLPAGVATM